MIAHECETCGKAFTTEHGFRGAEWAVDCPLCWWKKLQARRAACDHCWHYYGVINGRADYACTKCGMSKPEEGKP